MPNHDTKHDQATHQNHGAANDHADKTGATIKASTAEAGDAARRAVQSIEANPLAILAGGLAVGALAGALLPRSPREKELLAPLGQRLGIAARQAIAAARKAGKQQLDDAGLTRGAAKDRGRELLDGVVKAVSSAGTAAAQTATQSVKGEPQG